MTRPDDLSPATAQGARIVLLLCALAVVIAVVCWPWWLWWLAPAALAAPVATLLPYAWPWGRERWE